MIVKDSPNWERDQTGALLNTNESEYKAYLAKKKIIMTKNEEIATLKNQVNGLATEVDSINNKLDSILTLLKGNQ